jgi:short subunit dehydrogenase-like uncharacterized protein
MSQQQWMIYGANGYTGSLLAERAIAEGARPFLAGRDRDALKSMSDRYGVPFRVFELADVAAVTQALADIDAVVHCAGPFSATSAVMAEACIEAGTHYLDISGEIAVFEHLKELDERARAAAVTLLPGVGFDVVPSDCLAAHLHRELPDATHLELAFCGEGGASPGTLKTMIEMLGQGGRVRRDGEIVKVAAGYRQKGIVFSDGQRRHCMTIPWGDVSTAHASTGIADIRVYTAVPRMTGIITRMVSPMMIMLRLRPLQQWLKRRVELHVPGPTPQQLQDGCMRLWGEVRNGSGQTRTSWLDVPDGYQFTVTSSLHTVQRVLQGDAPVGFQTPSTAFGADYVTTLPDCIFTEVVSEMPVSAEPS